MSETQSLPLRLRLTKAQELIERGKQRRAIEELWQAQALACGRADAVHDLIHFTTSFEQRVGRRQRARLLELVAALEHDAEQADRRSPVSTPAPPVRAKTSAGRIALLVAAAVVSAAANLVVFVVWAFSTSCGICETPVGGYAEHMGGGYAIGAVVGVGLWLASVTVAARHRDGLSYLLIPFAGLVLYVPTLIVIAGVAKAIWGPMQCGF